MSHVASAREHTAAAEAQFSALEPHTAVVRELAGRAGAAAIMAIDSTQPPDREV